MRKQVIIINIILPVIALLLIVNFTSDKVVATSNTCSTNSCFTTDSMTFTDRAGLFRFVLSVFDSLRINEIASGLSSVITTMTNYITSTITILGGQCSGSSCYQNVNGGLLETIVEDILFPMIFILGTVFGFFYIGIKFFGVSVMVATFILLGLAYIGIIPSYFTLLSIIAVGAALTKLISGMIGDKGMD